MDKYAARDAKIIKVYLAASSQPNVDYHLIGEAVDPPLSYKQVKRILSAAGHTLKPAKKGRNTTEYEPLNDTFGYVAQKVVSALADPDKGMTEAELSKKTLIPERIIGKIVKGVHSISLMQALALSRGLGIPIEDLVKGYQG